jgi:hypothetical protein
MSRINEHEDLTLGMHCDDESVFVTTSLHSKSWLIQNSTIENFAVQWGMLERT